MSVNTETSVGTSQRDSVEHNLIKFDRYIISVIQVTLEQRIFTNLKIRVHLDMISLLSSAGYPQIRVKNGIVRKVVHYCDLNRNKNIA